MCDKVSLLDSSDIHLEESMVLPTNKGLTFRPEPLTPDEVRALINATSRRASSGVRLRALIAVMYGSGLRISEALALKPKDVSTTGCYIRVLDGKNGDYRTVGIDPRSCELLDRWLDRRAELGLNGRHSIFATYSKGQHGRSLSPVYVRRTLANLGRKANIEKRVHPHGLRHSLAFDLAQRGVPTHAIQAQLGHASLAVTDRYVRHLMPADVIDVMRARTW
jgi:integrase/recombinase XerD